MSGKQQECILNAKARALFKWTFWLKQRAYVFQLFLARPGPWGPWGPWALGTLGTPSPGLAVPAAVSSNPLNLINYTNQCRVYEWYIFDVCRYKLAVPCLDVFKATLDIFQIGPVSLSRFNHKTVHSLA